MTQLERIIKKYQDKCKHDFWCWGRSGNQLAYSCNKCNATKIGNEVKNNFPLR